MKELPRHVDAWQIICYVPRPDVRWCSHLIHCRRHYMPANHRKSNIWRRCIHGVCESPALHYYIRQSHDSLYYFLHITREMSRECTAFLLTVRRPDVVSHSMQQIEVDRIIKKIFPTKSNILHIAEPVLEPRKLMSVSNVKFFFHS